MGLSIYIAYAMLSMLVFQLLDSPSCFAPYNPRANARPTTDAVRLQASVSKYA